MAADLVATHTMMDHIGRYLPSVRMNGAAFSFVVDLIINYGSPVLHLVMVSLYGVQPAGWCVHVSVCCMLEVTAALHRGSSDGWCVSFAPNQMWVACVPSVAHA
jgi:hypothetical protein